MSLLYNGNYTAFKIDILNAWGLNETESNDPMWAYYIRQYWLFQIYIELDMLIKFYFGVAKGVVYPLGLLFQILTVIFLVRGNSGYSRSARNWFLMVLGSDIASILYRAYDLLTVDFQYGNPYTTVSSDMVFGQNFSFLMWGLRKLSDAAMQNIICKVFFIVLYFPIHLSPISLTVSALIRSYCVKFPLRAKAALTTRVDRILMSITVLLSLAISIIIGTIVISGFSDWTTRKVFGITVYYGDCVIPNFDYVATDEKMVFAGLAFMVAVIFVICLFNFISSVVIIIVLFEAKKSRKSMSASEATDSNAEVRATAMLLGMNITLFVCFFISRVMVLAVGKMVRSENPVAYSVVDRVGSYLFNIPYYTNMLFIAGFSKKFYEFYLPCLFREDKASTSVTSQKTMEESRIK